MSEPFRGVPKETNPFLKSQSDKGGEESHQKSEGPKFDALRSGIRWTESQPQTPSAQNIAKIQALGRQAWGTDHQQINPASKAVNPFADPLKPPFHEGPNPSSRDALKADTAVSQSLDPSKRDKPQGIQEVNPSDNRDIHKTEKTYEAVDPFADQFHEGFNPSRRDALKTNMQETGQTYKEIKGQIEGQWEDMLRTRSPIESYTLTLEYKHLRTQKKRELAKDSGAYSTKLALFRDKMVNQDTSSRIEVGTGSSENRSKGSTLSKLQKLPESGLGDLLETRENLINAYNDITQKRDKAEWKWGGLAAGTILSGGVSLLVSRKKFDNVVRSSSFYNAWLKELDRRLNISGSLKD